MSVGQDLQDTAKEIEYKSDLKSYAWRVTIFNYTDDTIRRIESMEAERIVVGIETCPKTGRLHLQCYFRFKKSCRWSWWKNQFPTWSVRIANKGDASNHRYCSKEGNVVVNKGFDYDTTERCTKRTRDEITDDVIHDVADGANWWAIRRKYGRFAFHNRRACIAWIQDERTIKANPDAPDPIL